MDAQATLHPDEAVDRFCRQYIQLERDLDYPPGSILQRQNVQDSLYKRLFAESALAHPPPLRYQLGVLKSLMNKIEGAIEDWDQYVRSSSHALVHALVRQLPASLVSHLNTV